MLDQLAAAELSEVNPHLRDDYRIAWITVRFAARSYASPHVAATYAVLGLHPEKVWPAIVEQRKALLGRWYEAFFPSAESSLPPKKPVQSVGRVEREQAA